MKLLILFSVCLSLAAAAWPWQNVYQPQVSGRAVRQTASTPHWYHYFLPYSSRVPIPFIKLQNRYNGQMANQYWTPYQNQFAYQQSYQNQYYQPYYMQYSYGNQYVSPYSQYMYRNAYVNPFQFQYMNQFWNPYQNTYLNTPFIQRWSHPNSYAVSPLRRNSYQKRIVPTRDIYTPKSGY